MPGDGRRCAGQQQTRSGQYFCRPITFAGPARICFDELTQEGSAVADEIRRDMLLGWPVLVVDDDPASLEVATFMMSFYGAKVSAALNGEEGLSLAQACRPRFI